MKKFKKESKLSKNCMISESLIMNWNKLDQSYNNLISKLCIKSFMSELVWKCFRCNLSFKDENVATLHKNISNHSVKKVKAITA
jgi:hypothetical protein